MCGCSSPITATLHSSSAWLCPALLQAEQREVSTDVGVQFARAHGCLFVETSAKGNVAVEQAFEELVHKVRARCCQDCVSIGWGGFLVVAERTWRRSRVTVEELAGVTAEVLPPSAEPCGVPLPSRRFWRRPASWPPAAARLASRRGSRRQRPVAAAEGCSAAQLGPLAALLYPVALYLNRV